MSTEDLCRCGHEREAHEHYRRGTDCALCGAAVCNRFSAANTVPPADGSVPPADEPVAPLDPAGVSRT